MAQKYAHYNDEGRIVGFYAEDIHTPESIPQQVVPITDEEWQDCLASPGKWAVGEGVLVLAPPPAPPTADELLAQIRMERDRKLKDPTLFERLDRYRNQRDGGVATTDTAEWFQATLQYMEELRNFPDTCDPFNPIWPTQPA